MRKSFQKAVLVTYVSNEGWIDSLQVDEFGELWHSFYVPELLKPGAVLPEQQSIVILQSIGSLKWKIVK